MCLHLLNFFTTNSQGDNGYDEALTKWHHQNAQGYSTLVVSVGEGDLLAIKEFKDNNNFAKLAWIILRAEIPSTHTRSAKQV